jgi:hypothetical protein
MDMTKFDGANDSGYIAVRDQLWLWVNALEKIEAQSTEEIRERRNEKYIYLGSVHSGGGSVFQGNLNAGRNININ